MDQDLLSPYTLTLQLRTPNLWVLGGCARDLVNNGKKCRYAE